MLGSLQLIPLRPFPLVEPGDDLAGLVAAALRAQQLQLVPGDVLVLAQKVVSKAENRYVRLSSVTPTPAAQELAAQADKDPRLVQLILDESREVLRVRPGVIIVEHRNGYVHANAGIDRSNLQQDPDDPQVLLLPQDPDRSAAALRDRLATLCGVAPQVVINDSAGRAWRMGTVGIAIGCAGLEAVRDQVGDSDLFGNRLEVTMPAIADELAAAASLVMGQAAEGTPLVLARGLQLAASEAGSGSLLRERDMDLFR
ncbi:coenzyme F420-0:L-glutamate ligase [Mangrovimicrobium sediminis]|uniref:Coenzyme F420-0:L-glutamate ligase n=1 Tax=Mangrovimicrobium sediminis TaxID=2562682 RepID=A0A4Z0M560_9GAMM|nr:coenzyme F420-0:L-glutamate ligase [Haliea sp. SAOS-164]TGD74567.1 coenzyme F420-0:L-glutamate ligase [Haliea sp. SAOS-164]